MLTRQFEDRYDAEVTVHLQNGNRSKSWSGY
jgi:hypothetical protein